MILTTHAQERQKLRKISLSSIEKVVRDPEIKRPAKDGATKFIRTVNGRRFHVVANWRAKEHDWVVISVWVRGEDDPQPLLWRIIVWLLTLKWRLLRGLLRFLWRKLRGK